jgi:hypothetical protein
VSTRWTDDASAQRHYPKAVILATIASAGAPPAGTLPVYFRAPVVDARIRLKITLFFVDTSDASFNPDISGFAKLWLCEADEDPDHMGGGRTFPVTNIEGTQALPTSIPAAPPLMGYSREFQSAADYIEGKFTLVNAGTIASGSWVLRTRYQPAPGQRFTPEEWQQITPLAQPVLFNNPKISY